VNTYAASLTESHETKIEWMEALGFYGEMTNPPTVKDQLENIFLDDALRQYILLFKLLAIMSIIAAQNPNSSQSTIIREALEYFMGNPNDLIDRISTNNGTIPNFEDYIKVTCLLNKRALILKTCLG
jgi:hypothetical protein